MRVSRQSQLVQDSFDPFGQMKGALVTDTPWGDIETFATHPAFCGLKLYPKQLTLLKLMFLETENMTEYDIDVISRWAEGFKDPTSPEGVQPDIWERVDYLKKNGYRRFPHIQMVMGRRASKGVLGGVVVAEHIAYFYSLDDWQAHYGLPPGKDGYAMCLATNMVQAKRFQFADIRATVERCKYLQPAISTSKEYALTLRTAADLRRIARMEKDNIPIEREVASLRIMAMSSNSASGRGATTFCLDPETEITMSDNSKKKLKNLVIGDILKGIEEYGDHRPVETVVQAKTSVRKAAYRVTLEDGTQVICSEDHKWLDGDGEWREMRDLEVGDSIAEYSE